MMTLHSVDTSTNGIVIYVYIINKKYTSNHLAFIYFNYIILK